MNLQSYTYNPATEKVVPKSAVIIRDWLPGPLHREGLLNLLRENHWSHLADEIERETEEAVSIREPGLWGVVEARLAGDEKRARLKYVRTDHHTWTCVGGARRSWNELRDATLVRPGIEDGS